MRLSLTAAMLPKVSSATPFACENAAATPRSAHCSPSASQSKTWMSPVWVELAATMLSPPPEPTPLKSTASPLKFVPWPPAITLRDSPVAKSTTQAMLLFGLEK